MELKVGKFDSVLLDLNLGRENGLDILEQIHKFQPNLPVIIFSAQGSVKNAVEAMRRGAVDFLEKPFSPEQIRLVLARVQRFQQLNQKIERLEPEDLPAELRGQTGSGAKGDGASLEVGSLVSMKQLEEAHLRKVLERAANFAEAAQVLGIDQATLYRKRKKIGLE
jgi:DNA-binding NtrC family response regulator